MRIEKAAACIAPIPKQCTIKEVLQLMKKEKWTFPADIELEYRIPAGSNSVAEVAKCLQYCKEALA